jgi:hypothetical protein
MLDAMKHAGPDALERLEPLLASLREVPALREKSSGVFYLGSKAFLHFHEDPSGLYADVRLIAGQDFIRKPVNTRVEQDWLLRQVRATSSRQTG